MHPRFLTFSAHKVFALGLCAALPLCLLPTNVDSADIAPTKPPVAIDDSVLDFLKQSTLTRLAILEASRVAQERASAPQVAQYAKRLIGEESLLLERLQGLAARLGVPLPDPTHEKVIERVAKLEGKSAEHFDKAYYGFLTDAYDRDIVNFDFASRLEHLEVRQFAIQYRTMFERQLEEIDTLQKPVA